MEAGTDDRDERLWYSAYHCALVGEFEQGEEIARRLLNARPAVAHAARITLGSILRQRERHTEAEDVDEQALRSATSDDERGHALISLVADAIGRFDLRAATERLDRARRDVGVDPRSSIRLGWVRVEHALLAAEPRNAVEAGRVTVALARSVAWPKHLAKSLLFCGVALNVAGAVEAERMLRDAAERADAIHAVPIASAAREALARRAASGRA